ncbi:MAG: glycosyltransferase family 2 protein [Chloroflexota bacterium]|nr:glycosyltransferase family 2 protein [Chloroflexota bacterium]
MNAGGEAVFPRWSVLIPTWNGRHLLEEALGGLDAQVLRDFEIVVVDDGSDDDTVAWMGDRRRDDRLIKLPTQSGLAAALNRGIEAARGQFIAVLNNDAVPEPGWLEALDCAFAAAPGTSFLASRIRLYDDPLRLHAAGDTYGRNGLPGNRGVWEADGPPFTEPCEVFGACAAAAAYRRELFDDIGVFDEDLVMYCEDVDLDWRAQLAGHRCRYVPDAVVRHRLSATAGGEIASYLVARNRPLVAVMNLPGFLWRRGWWRIAGAQLRLAFEALRAIQGRAARATLAGQLASLGHLPRAWRKRSRRQRSRRVADDYIDALLER